MAHARFSGMVRTVRGLAIALAVAVVVQAVLVPAGRVRAPGYVPHGPILIAGDADFTAANGVTGGSGTPADPYVISGWDIEVCSANGIDIRDTTVPFVIRSIYIHGSSSCSVDAIALHRVAWGTIEQARIEGVTRGITLDAATEMMITGVSVSVPQGAVYAYAQSQNVTITNSSFVNTELYFSGGIELRNSSISGGGVILLGNRNRIANCTFSDGLVVTRAINSTIEDSIFLRAGVFSNYTYDANLTISGNTFVGDGSTSSAVYYYAVSYITVSGNSFSWYSTALLSWGNTTTNITIAGNRFVNNSVGLQGGGGWVFHNAFLNNTRQVVWPFGAFDDGYPDGGNFWSDYTGVDAYGGPNQGVPGSDGIGDTPYAIPNSTVADRYPLMLPWAPAPDEPPIPRFSVTPASGNVSTTFAFDASNSTDDRDPPSSLQVRWDFEGDGVWDTAWSTNKNATHTYAIPGRYVVSVQVMDFGGLTSMAADAVDVAALPLGVRISANPVSGALPLLVDFTSTVTGGWPPFQYEWHFGDGTTASGSSTVQHMYTSSGTFTAYLYLYDSRDAYAVDALTVDVGPSAASLRVVASAAPTQGVAPLAVSFTATAYGGTPPYGYVWAFGDGSTATEQNPTHMYVSPGTFTATLTVTDSGAPQNSTRSDASVLVTAAPILTACAVLPSAASVPLEVSLAFTAIGFSGPNELPGVSVAWTTAGNIGTITAGGVFTAATPGSGVVTAEASFGGVTVLCSSAVVVPNGPLVPTVTIDAPVDGAVLNGSTVVVSGRASNAERVQVRADMGTWANASGVTTWTFMVSGLLNGLHQLTARALLGNLSSEPAVVLITLNTSEGSPVIDLLSPEEGTSVHGTLSLFGTATAGATVLVSLDGGPFTPVASADANGTWILSLDTTPFSDGSHTIAVKAASPGGESTTISRPIVFRNAATATSPLLAVAVGLGALNLILLAVVAVFLLRRRHRDRRSPEGVEAPPSGKGPKVE